MLADKAAAGAKVLVFGTDALVAEVVNRGFMPVRTADADVAAVVQGLSQDAGWRDLAEACLAIRAGAFWVACNTDATLPTERGSVAGRWCAGRRAGHGDRRRRRLSRANRRGR